MKNESAKKRNVDLEDHLESIRLAHIASVEEEDPIRRIRAQNRVSTQTRSNFAHTRMATQGSLGLLPHRRRGQKNMNHSSS